ncbi:hypothetical protein DFA_00205 [Cavenderia fasciculata]|uniref:Cupin 2 conserved barrel domain-containing protein n=1 Tax=Cavenderia fasciculata TaxID=261658 RepID=F4PXW7_CACFS|nr:uncharacterized protein DFA_00205 [Cavenderia fasciculata]EGG19627.1 hypothetical protein DFA_00205 [Cavenderia fasciculata]|eukprot:XP_004357921.1 hypothetical protein DFA_00205 [Cavenderia fasciculata]
MNKRGVIEYSNVGNLLDNVPVVKTDGDEVFESLFDKQGIKIERIVSNGQCSPDDFWYDQEQEEWVFLIKGSASLEIKDDKTPTSTRMIDLVPGSYVQIPAHLKHRVAKTDTTQQTIWLALFFPSSKLN